MIKAISIIPPIVNAIKSNFDWGKEIMNDRINQEGILAVYSFEVLINLNLLYGIKIEDGKLAPSEIRNASFIQLVNMLENSIGMAIVYSQDRTNLKNFIATLRKNNVTINEVKEDEESSDNVTKQFNILDAIALAVIKIETLKRIVAIVSQTEDKCSFFPTIILVGELETLKNVLKKLKVFYRLFVHMR